MMGQLTVVTGGARSGKSRYAESQLIEKELVYYIATGISDPNDQEMQDRIHHHRLQRPSQWQTHEGYLNLPTFFKEHQKETCSYLFDCATLFTTNYFFYLLGKTFDLSPTEYDEFIEKMSMTDVNKLEKEIMVEWKKIIAELKNSRAENCFIVTNEIGLGLVPMNKFGRLFRDILGRVNQYLAKEADAVYFVISGLPQKIK